MTTTPKTTTDPLGDWFRHIGTKLSDTDYEAGIKAIAWARDKFQPEHHEAPNATRTNADTSDISTEPSDAEIQAAAEALLIADTTYDGGDPGDVSGHVTDRHLTYARAALVAALKVARHE